MAAETNYLASDQVAKLFDLILQLASEVHVVTQRLSALEALLVRSGALSSGQLDAFIPSSDEKTEFDARRDQLLQGLLRVVTEAGPAEHPLRPEWEAMLRREGRGTAGQ
jgi:hypothetical protein